MRIHSNVLTGADHQAAAEIAGVGFARLNLHRSQSRARAFEVILEGSGRHGNQYGNSGTHGAAARQAALWDEWGIYLGELFRRDPAAVVRGMIFYESGEHFAWVTGNRFDTLTTDQVHRRHIWDQPRGSAVAGGAYHVSGCRCGAVLRQLATWKGYTWADINGTETPAEPLTRPARRRSARRASTPSTPAPAVSSSGLGKYASDGAYERQYLATVGR